jgi:hypothetical protein
MKKILFIVLTAVTALGCNNGGTKIGLEDSRPESEKALIREINVADSSLSAQINEVTKKESYEKSIKRISQFITEELKAKAESWQARVYKIDLDIDDAVLVDLMISKGVQFEDEFPQYNSIVLKCRIKNDEHLKDMIKPLQKGDDVVVSGNFSTTKNALGDLQFESYGDVSFYDEVSNPAFFFDITDIKKK